MRGQAKSGREDRRGHRSPAEHESVAGRAAVAAARRANDCRRSVRSTRAQRHRRAGSPFHGEEAKLPKGCGAFRTADQTISSPSVSVCPVSRPRPSLLTSDSRFSAGARFQRLARSARANRQRPTACRLMARSGVCRLTGTGNRVRLAARMPGCCMPA